MPAARWPASIRMQSMTRKFSIMAALLLCTVATVGSAQVGHPAKGSWLGYWGPDDEVRNRILLVLDWESRELVGTINPGRNSVPVDRASVDYDTWTMTVEAPRLSWLVSPAGCCMLLRPTYTPLCCKP